MPEDYEQQVTIRGSFAGDLKVVAVDANGQLYSLMVGANGQVIAVDADGNIKAVLLGNAAGTLTTIAVDATGKILAQLYGMYGTTPVPVATDAEGRLSVTAFDQTNISADSTEATTLDTPILTLVSNLNRIRHWIVALSGEAWGTITTSTAALWAKFHATTGHAHDGSANGGAQITYANLASKPDTDLTPYTKIDGTRAFTGDQSMGSHKLTNLAAPTDDNDAARKVDCGAVTGVIKADGTVAFTGDQSMGSHKLTSVTNPNAAQDAATKNYVDAVGQAWATWTPTLVWGTGNPTNITTIARWTRIGRIVFFYIILSSTDSNGCTSLTITLPVSILNLGNYPAVTSIEQYRTASDIFANPIAYIHTGDNQIKFYDFKAATDGQYIVIQVSGQYEVA